MQRVITDDLEALLDVLPPHIRQPLVQQKDVSELLEVVLDLGRPPEARFPQREIMLHSKEVVQEDIDHITSRISPFGDDNRAGIERTLHRISAIRNRKGRIVGLTCRVGRAVFGTIKIIEDLIETGNSILLLGRPGVGKTTMLREVARVLADDLKRRVVIVDTSNEIAGDGDIPHPAIGHARRMQVTTPALQHAVMIEAVENHMPQVIVIDEIGTELEAQAARTIAERGVQLVGTAHGNTLENLLMNPTLSDLVGGVQTVTLSDEEARRRGTQKSIQERMAPPTFQVVVEIQNWEKVSLHPDVSEAVDSILRGRPQPPQLRWIDEEGNVKMESEAPDVIGRYEETPAPTAGRRVSEGPAPGRNAVRRVFLFGVNRGRLDEAARDMHIGLEFVNGLHEADFMVTSKQYYRRRPQKIRDAELAKLPIYVLKSNTNPQMRQLLHAIYPASPAPVPARPGKADSLHSAIAEAEQAVNQVIGGQEGAVELSPQGAYIRRLQHLIAERHNLASQSTGREPDRRVKIFKEES